MSNKPARRFCFTLNNYTPADLTEIQEFATHDKVVYVCYGLEEAPTTGTPHVQGYFSIRVPSRVTGIARKFQEFSFLQRSRFEIANGTQAQNRAYCFKTRAQDEVPNEETFESDSSQQGRRTDLEKAIAVLRDAGMASLVEEYPSTYVKFHNGLRSLAERYEKPRDSDPTVVWWYGDTGTGKTFTAFKWAHDHGLSTWKSSRSLKWWPHYEQQDVVIIDDFRKDFVTFHGLLTILDRYPETVEVKGGHRQLNSQFFIITSCYPPWSVYETREDVGQLLRRINQIVRFHQRDQLESGGCREIATRLHPEKPQSDVNVNFAPAGGIRGDLLHERVLDCGRRPGKRPYATDLSVAAAKKGLPYRDGDDEPLQVNDDHFFNGLFFPSD